MADKPQADAEKTVVGGKQDGGKTVKVSTGKTSGKVKAIKKPASVKPAAVGGKKPASVTPSAVAKRPAASRPVVSRRPVVGPAKCTWGTVVLVITLLLSIFAVFAVFVKLMDQTVMAGAQDGISQMAASVGGVPIGREERIREAAEAKKINEDAAATAQSAQTLAEETQQFIDQD
jgi:hypothetical protein